LLRLGGEARRGRKRGEEKSLTLFFSVAKWGGEKDALLEGLCIFNLFIFTYRGESGPTLKREGKGGRGKK